MRTGFSNNSNILKSVNCFFARKCVYVLSAFWEIKVTARETILVFPVDHIYYQNAGKSGLQTNYWGTLTLSMNSAVEEIYLVEILFLRMEIIHERGLASLFHWKNSYLLSFCYQKGISLHNFQKILILCNFIQFVLYC